MLTYLRLYADADGYARFEDVEASLVPPAPAPHELSMSAPAPASGVIFVRAPAGGSHPERPETRRHLAIVLSGECEVTASGETRVGGTGDVLLVEDTHGVGHSSRTEAGFTAVLVVLPDEPPAPAGT